MVSTFRMRLQFHAATSLQHAACRRNFARLTGASHLVQLYFTADKEFKFLLSLHTRAEKVKSAGGRWINDYYQLEKEYAVVKWVRPSCTTHTHTYILTRAHARTNASNR